jgi:hypothetical protein
LIWYELAAAAAPTERSAGRMILLFALGDMHVLLQRVPGTASLEQQTS